MNGIMVSAPGSGYGKTTVTMGLLAILKRRGISVCAFKCGPDYIDPAFHARVLGVPCRNLDTFLMGEKEVMREVSEAAERYDFCIVEGAMGLYDGLGGTEKHSAYAIATLLSLSVVLVMDDKREGWEEEHQQMIARDENHLICGMIQNNWTEDAVPSRHLGLVQSSEISNFQRKIDGIVAELEKNVDVNEIINAAKPVPMSVENRTRIIHKEDDRNAPKIAVAKDEAFSFYYGASLHRMEEEGAKLCYFSPLHDDVLPEGICGLYLGGGYPELYAKGLSENTSMRENIREALQRHLPTIAECGGFLYLGEELFDESQTNKEESRDNGAKESYPMVGFLKGTASKQVHLVRFGYGMMRSESDGLLFRSGEEIPFHEFHYLDSTENGSDFYAYKPLNTDKNWRFGYQTDWLYAGFPHFYYGEKLAKRFVDAAMKYEMKNRWNSLAKPLYSLGRLEEEITRIGILKRNANVTMNHPRLYVLCADNGIIAEGVSQSDETVTLSVARALGEGTSTVSYMANEVGCEVIPVDVGMKYDVPEGLKKNGAGNPSVADKSDKSVPCQPSGLWDYKIANGTKNFAKEPAMTKGEMERAFAVGEKLVGRAVSDDCDILLLGEMGIGNTTTSTAIASVLLGVPPKEITGAGAGLSEEGVKHKAKVIENAIHFYGWNEFIYLGDDSDEMAGKTPNQLSRGLKPQDCERLLQTLGGFDLAVMVGIFFEAYKRRMPVLLDGVITGVAALLAYTMDANVRDVMLPSHLSGESVAKMVLDELGLQPVIDAEMHLGEGSGAVAALSVYRSALAVYQSGHTFEHLGIEAYREFKCFVS